MENYVKKIYHSLPISETTRTKIRKILKRDYVRPSAGKVDIYAYQYPKLQNSTGKRVSVVIPNYNYEKYIIERIDSILFQTYPIYELIIIDDCSSDNSVEVIQNKIQQIMKRKLVPVRFLQNKVNSGNVFAQWKRAFEEASGDYVWIAEADDSCDAHFLETIMQGFEDNETVISYCESLTMDENNNILMGDLRPWIDQFNCGKWNSNYIKNGIEEIAETMCINNTIANVSSVVFKKGNYTEFIEEARSFHLAGDWYVYMRVLESGKIAYFRESLNYHRMQKQGLTLSTRHEQEFEEIVRLQDYALSHYPISEEVKEKVLERRERERIRFGL